MFLQYEKLLTVAFHTLAMMEEICEEDSLSISWLLASSLAYERAAFVDCEMREDHDN